jgi:hypothetical protein
MYVQFDIILRGSGLGALRLRVLWEVEQSIGSPEWFKEAFKKAR